MSNSIRHITTKRPFTESARSKLLPSAGVHVTVDAFVSDPDKVFKETHLQTLFTSLVSALDMKILHGPEFIEVPVDPEILRKSQESKEFLDEGGITGMCVISKSHIAIHCWPLQRFFSMDVFSCGDYDPEVALKIIRTHMGVQNESTHIINRRKPITQAPSVYCITNKINNKKYVGKSKDPEARLGQHIWTSGHPDHNGYMPIHAAIAKYGLVNFSFSILQEYASDAEAFEGERKWVLELRTNNREFGYNLNGGGTSR
jgi:S-adenosylmethionine decarboxylase